MASPRVSILTPTYNHAAFIERCVRSVLAQSFEDWELIVVDDGSSDGTGDRVRAFADARIHYHHQERAGLDGIAKTYNRALASARGDLVAILEGDDYWPSHKLATQVPDFDDAEIVLSYGHTLEVGEHGEPLKTMPSRDVPADALINTPVGRAAAAMMDVRFLTFLFPVSVVIRKSGLDAIGGFQSLPRLPLVDFPTFLALTRHGRFAFHPEVLGYWQRHAQSTTRNQFFRILAGVHRQIDAFVAAHERTLPLRPGELAAIRESWRTLELLQWFTLARWLLADGAPADARRALTKCRTLTATRRDRWLVRTAFAASVAGTNLERLARPLGLPELRPLLDAHNRENVMISKEMLDDL